MKNLKRCDGYVLPYVLVVFLILSAVAVSICTVSLNNLQAQEAAVKRAQALYTAEGEVEKVVAKIWELPECSSTERTFAISAFWEPIVAAGITPAKVDDELPDTYSLQLSVMNDGVKVDADIRVTLNISPETISAPTDEDPDNTVTYYKVTGISALKYQTYTISYEGGAAG